MHLLPMQQSPSPPQISPSCPHGGLPGWQSPFTQLFEQHSPLEEHSEHSGVHPPAGVHRLVAASQIREQQSLFEPQTSSTWRMQFILSLVMHMGREPHRSAAGPTLGHAPAQQAEPWVHTSPRTLQP
jgi:hypothetical protein